MRRMCDVMDSDRITSTPAAKVGHGPSQKGHRNQRPRWVSVRGDIRPSFFFPLTFPSLVLSQGAPHENVPPASPGLRRKQREVDASRTSFSGLLVYASFITRKRVL